jgi:hypothetical protein
MRHPTTAALVRLGMTPQEMSPRDYPLFLCMSRLLPDAGTSANRFSDSHADGCLIVEDLSSPCAVLVTCWYICTFIYLYFK